ncbi:MAG: STAS domain-containing protein [Bryobacterales bacterium]|nr:STAS domain-containing protein [Bryobacterales bacterium]MBV9398028.1 STAS domain-containing protein [Bryobacterales bacterium]
MFIELLQQDEICILRFRGRIASGAQLDYLDSELQAIRALDANRMLADLHDVSSIGSTGLGFIVAIFASITNRPCGRFVMTGLNDHVRKAFDVTRLSEIIPIAADMSTAIAELRELSPCGAGCQPARDC